MGNGAARVSGGGGTRPSAVAKALADRPDGLESNPAPVAAVYDRRLRSAWLSPGGHRPPATGRGPPRGPASLLAPLLRAPSRFHFFAPKNFSPLKTGLDSKYFASRKYLTHAFSPDLAWFSEEKQSFPAFWGRSGHRRVVVAGMSTKKVTENLQKPPLI